MDNNNYLSVPLGAISGKLTVTLCGQQPQANSMHFDKLNSSWLEDFLKEIDLYSPNEQKNKIKGKIQIFKEDVIYRVEEKIEFEPLLECARSLTLFREKCTAVGKCFYTNKSYSDTNTSHSISRQFDEEVCLSEEDLDAYSYKGNVINLDEFVLDLLQTSLPAIPLCKENCRGLCQECGANLNEKHLCKSKNNQ